MIDLYTILIVESGVYEHAIQGTGEAIVVYPSLREAKKHCRIYRDELGPLEPVKIATINLEDAA